MATIKKLKHQLCHRCIHNGKGNVACLTCKDPVLTAHQGAVSIAALTEIGREPAVEPAVYDDSDDVATEPTPTFAAMLEPMMIVIQTFMLLTPEQFSVVKALYHERKIAGFVSYKSVGEKLGIDRHKVSAILDEALEVCPALQAMRLKCDRADKRMADTAIDEPQVARKMTKEECYELYQQGIVSDEDCLELNEPTADELADEEDGNL